MKESQALREVRRRVQLLEQVEAEERKEERLCKKAERTDPDHVCLLGEIRPGVDYSEVDGGHEALIVALRFAKAFSLDTPVIVGETSLLDLERRVFYEAQRTKLARLAEDGTLSELETTVEDKPFDEVWTPLPDSNLPITQDQLDAALAEIGGSHV